MKAILKLIPIIAWIALTGLAAALLNKILKNNREERTIRLMHWCFRGVLKIVGVRVAVRGQLAESRPLMLVTNHSSYLDVPILGAFVPVRFTPKTEVGNWPGIGTMCRLIGCVFIDRKAHKTQENQEKLRKVLEEGRVVCLFPEGTTSDGKRLLPFHSSYFSLGEAKSGLPDLHVQPAAIRYTHVHGLPLDASLRPKIAWYGDMELLPHLLELLKLGPIRAELVFAPPLSAQAYENRKELSAACHQAVAQALGGGLA